MLVFIVQTHREGVRGCGSQERMRCGVEGARLWAAGMSVHVVFIEVGGLPLTPNRALVLTTRYNNAHTHTQKYVRWRERAHKHRRIAHTLAFALEWNLILSQHSRACEAYPTAQPHTHTTTHRPHHTSSFDRSFSTCRTQFIEWQYYRHSRVRTNTEDSNVERIRPTCGLTTSSYHTLFTSLTAATRLIHRTQHTPASAHPLPCHSTQRTCVFGVGHCFKDG